MHPRTPFALVSLSALLAACAPTAPRPTDAGAAASPMSFFVTSVNPGKGADFGGLAGADAYVRNLPRRPAQAEKLARLPQHHGQRRCCSRQRA